MNNLWLKIKVWAKIILAALIVLYVLSFVYRNGDKKVTVWWVWFGSTPEIRLLPLLFFTFLLGALVLFLVRTTFATLRQVRDLRARQRSEKLEQEVADMKAKAARLQTRPPPDEPDVT